MRKLCVGIEEVEMRREVGEEKILMYLKGEDSVSVRLHLFIIKL